MAMVLVPLLQQTSTSKQQTPLQTPIQFVQLASQRVLFVEVLSSGSCCAAGRHASFFFL